MAGELSIDLNLTGISIHTAPIGVLERFALSAEEVREVYRRLLGKEDVLDALHLLRLLLQVELHEALVPRRVNRMTRRIERGKNRSEECRAV